MVMRDRKKIFELSPLFEDVQMSKVFPDGKTFVDCIPKADIQLILDEYMKRKSAGDFNLKDFVFQHFQLPHVFSADTVHYSASVEEHINQLWNVLTRQPDEAGGSLIPLPHPYVVPGGRFGEVYYWDSYFTMLGLHVSGLYDLIENMVKNFAHLIDTVGFIPNGNRAYYLGRSQPPFFSLMMQLLAATKGKQILIDYLPALEKEYVFWMKGKDQLNNRNRAVNHAVLMSDHSILNRYWDTYNTPRPESYREDVELAHNHPQPEILYRHLRAGAASGWDYSCRWFKDINAFGSIHTTEIIPVDLNCMLYHLEQTIAEAHQLNKNASAANEYTVNAEKRKQAIRQYCWNEQLQFYTDYDFMTDEKKQVQSLAASATLFFGIATQPQADAIAFTLENEFLKNGGLVTTLHNTGQQWDAPNGWAPLQWMSIAGLEKYNHHRLAATIAQRWIQLNKDVFTRTSKLMEKYNVIDTHLEAGGGEYEGQDGFGWTNGVLLALMKKFK
jgi:alpha,alpha-trehalase